MSAPGAHELRGQRGMALIGVVVLTALLLGLAATLAITVRSDTELRGTFASAVTGFYAAESGLNMGMGDYRNIFLNYDIPDGSDFALRSIEVGERQVAFQMTERPGNPQSVIIPSGELFSGLNSLQYRYVVTSQANDINGDVEASVGAEFLVGYIPLFQFIAFYKNDLEILPGAPMVLNGRVHTNGRLYLNSDATLDINDNPAQQVLTVQVSSGEGIYRGRKNSTACDGTVSVDKLEDIVAPFSNLDPNLLPCVNGTTRHVPVSELAVWRGSMIPDVGNIAIPEPDIIKPPASVSAGGDADPGVYWTKADLRIVLHLDDPGQLPGGAVLPHRVDVVDGSGLQDAVKTAALHAFMTDGAWNSGSVGGRGPSSYPGTMPIFYTDVPAPGASGCVQGVYACGNANVSSYAPAIPAPGSPSGRTITAAGAYSEVMGTGVVPGGAFTFDGDYRRGGWYNHREKKWMLLLNINLRDLLLWNQQNGEPFFATDDTSEGGIVIFATVSGLDSGRINNYGVRVFGTADVPLPGGIGVSVDPTGVTVVSDQAMYVLGDFNRGTAAGGAPRQPASLIGDSINVMSQGYWQSSVGAVCGANCCTDRFCRDGQSVQGLNAPVRDAQNTWVNAALLGGVDTTMVGTYNGGLENYPRFHEDWGGKSLTYQGSFVSLGEPQHVDGIWCGTGGNGASGCNIYNPPTRLWNFDPAFNDVANLPPLTPRFVYVQQVLFTEDFK